MTAPDRLEYGTQWCVDCGRHAAWMTRSQGCPVCRSDDYTTAVRDHTLHAIDMAQKTSDHMAARAAETNEREVGE